MYIYIYIYIYILYIYIYLRIYIYVYMSIYSHPPNTHPHTRTYKSISLHPYIHMYTCTSICKLCCFLSCLLSPARTLRFSHMRVSQCERQKYHTQICAKFYIDMYENIYMIVFAVSRTHMQARGKRQPLCCLCWCTSLKMGVSPRRLRRMAHCLWYMNTHLYIYIYKYVCIHIYITVGVHCSKLVYIAQNLGITEETAENGPLPVGN